MEWFLGEGVVSDDIVGEVVEDFHGEEEAGRRDVLVPSEDRAVDDLNLVDMATRFGRSEEVVLLHCSERGRNFNDVELRTCVDLGVDFADVVEDIEHKGTSSGSHLIDEEVMVGISRQTIVIDEVPGDSLAIVRAEELRRGVPELASWVLGTLVCVELVLEGGVAVAQLGLELDLVAD